METKYPLQQYRVPFPFSRPSEGVGAARASMILQYLTTKRALLRSSDVPFCTTCLTLFCFVHVSVLDGRTDGRTE